MRARQGNKATDGVFSKGSVKDGGGFSIATLSSTKVTKRYEVA